MRDSAYMAKRGLMEWETHWLKELWSISFRFAGKMECCADCQYRRFEEECERCEKIQEVFLNRKAG